LDQSRKWQGNHEEGWGRPRGTGRLQQRGEGRDPGTEPAAAGHSPACTASKLLSQPGFLPPAQCTPVTIFLVGSVHHSNSLCIQQMVIVKEKKQTPPMLQQVWSKECRIHGQNMGAWRLLSSHKLGSVIPSFKHYRYKAVWLTVSF